MLLFGLGITYFGALIFCYVRFISPVYEYAGLTYRVLPIWCWFVAVSLALVPLLWMPIEYRRPSDFASILLYVCVVGPSCIFPFLILNETPEEILPLPISFVLAYGLFDFIRRGRRRRVNRIVISFPAYAFFLSVLLVVLSILAFSIAGFKLNLSFADVYERRMIARETVPTESLLAYATQFLGTIFVPLALIIGMLKKKWTLVLLAVLGTLANFSLNGSKYVMFAPVALTAIVFIAENRRGKAGLWILALMGMVVLLGLAETLVVQTSAISETITRRQLMMPAQLTSYYWEYFSSHPFVFLRDSIFGKLAGFSSTVYTPMLIGHEYFLKNWTTNANAHIWGNAYAQFGYFGIALASIVGGSIMRIVDDLARPARFSFASGVCAMIGMAWTNTALHTSFLSDGVLGLVIALYLSPIVETLTLVSSRSKK
jgi:hypothetical protein